MAATQQLARASWRVIVECRSDTRSLHDLCSFRSLPEVDYLDLDWAPHLLEAIAAESGLPGELITLLTAATGGEDEVNPDYREVSDSVWEHPVSLLWPARAAEVSRALRELAEVGFPNKTITNLLVQTRPLGRLPEHPYQYAAAHFGQLLKFYEEAVRRGLGTVMWWD